MRVFLAADVLASWLVMVDRHAASTNGNSGILISTRADFL